MLLDPDYLTRRPVGSAHGMSRLLAASRGARSLDYGAGTGLFAQRMMELGFHGVASYDPFSLPQRRDGVFDIVTCTEVIEHSPTRGAFLDEMLPILAPDRRIVLGESLQPADIDSLRCNWWYVAPRNGHVSTFADRTLALLAERNVLIYHRGTGHPHVRRRWPISPQAAGQALACYRLGTPGHWPTAGLHGVKGLLGNQLQWTTPDRLASRVQVPPDRRAWRR